jgi:cysteine synthase B
MSKQIYKTIDQCVGGTPLVRLQRLNPNPSNIILAKLEGNNPAGSVKDRAALNMITEAENRGEINPGDTLIEATSGNTGIALAMVAAIKGYKIILVMQENLSQERRDAMTAYGAELILVSKELGMEGARDLADKMSAENKAHNISTAKEIWNDTNGEVTHFVSSMGTTGTIMGVSKYLKEKNPSIQIIGIQPDADSHIPGIRRWPEEYLPTIFDASRVDTIMDVSQKDAEQATRDLAIHEGIFSGVSAGGAVASAMKLSNTINNAVIVTIICDRGDRYLSTGVFKGLTT